VPLARALVKGGLPVLEITFRTGGPGGPGAIAREVPEAVVGAGRCSTRRQLRQAIAAGARFGVSPGCTPALAQAVKAPAALPAGRPDRVGGLALAEHGLPLLKFFPADAAGGPTWLKAVAAPLAGLGFCPTGGIGIDTAPAYLAPAQRLPCVGGSWVAPREAVTAGDWAHIERLAATAAALKRS
jgi:2-dehydro-3-deoxyphosphogluconate aldolase/(4S)-4-hydroxy-2-oxoglutarate aldolase